jgi:hypothetical protein
VLFQADGTRVELANDDETPFRTIWQHGEYLVGWNNSRRPAIFINDGPDLILERELDPRWKELGPTSPQYGKLTFRIPLETLPKPGEMLPLRFLAVGGTNDTTDPEVGETMRRAMGLAGDPAYTIEMEHGAVHEQRLVLTLDGKDGGVACRIPRAELPMALPLVVEGMNPNWPVVLVDRAQDRWRPLGVYLDRAYATLDTLAGDWLLFIGHPVTASEPDVVLTLAQIGARAWVLEVHNPTDRALTVAVAPSPYFTLLDWGGATLVLSAGTSQTLALTGKTLGVEAFV